MIPRTHLLDRVHQALKRSRVVALIGPRQCGKTTLARQIVPVDAIEYFDLENPRDLGVTRVGKFIRSTNIDELPQLFNVLKGEISLAGPRPPLPYEVEKYKSRHLRRLLEVRPGSTGLWQVDGHNTTTFHDMVRIDLRYIRNCSLFLDLSILFRTVKLFLERLWLTAIQN